MRRAAPWVLGAAAAAAGGALLLAWPRPAPAPAPPPPVAEALAEPEGLELIRQVLAEEAPGLPSAVRRPVALAILEETQATGIDPLLVLALIDVESDYQAAAVSPKGAVGLMQLRPATLVEEARRAGLRQSAQELAADPALTVRLGIRYLARLEKKFKDRDLALLAYNLGPAKLRRVRRANGLAQYQGYARAVKREWIRLQQAQGIFGEWALAARTPGSN